MFRPKLRFAPLVGVALVIVTVLAAPIGGAATFQVDDPGPPDDAGPPDGEGPPDDAGPPDDDDDSDEQDEDDEDDDDDEDEDDGDDDERDDDVGEDDDDEGEEDENDDEEEEDDDEGEEDENDDEEAEEDGEQDGEDEDGEGDEAEEDDNASERDETDGNERREGGDDEAGGTDDADGTDDTDRPDDADEDGSTTPTVVADHPDAPSVGVVNVSTDQSAVEAGEPVEIDVTLANRAESDRTVPVRLRLFGEVANRAETTVPAGETRTVTFVHEVVQPGAYEPSVYGASDEFVVEPADGGDGGDDASDDDSLAGFGAPAAVTALVVGVSALRRRAS